MDLDGEKHEEDKRSLEFGAMNRPHVSVVKVSNDDY
jgi:hypothetical protein